MSGDTRVLSKSKVLAAKKDALEHAARAFADSIGTGRYLTLRRALEKAAVDLVLAERDLAEPSPRGRSVRDYGTGT